MPHILTFSGGLLVYWLGHQTCNQHIAGAILHL